MKIFGYLMVVFTLFILSCNYKLNKSEYIFVPIDTIIFPVKNPIRINSRYNNRTCTNYISFIDVGNMNIFLITNDSNNNRTEHIFCYKNAIRNFKKENFNLFYFFKDTSSVYILLKNPIFPGNIKQSIVQIDSKGKFRTLKIWNSSNEIYYIQPPNKPFNFTDTNIFIATCFHEAKLGTPSLNDYQTNLDSRKKVFSQPPTLLFEINDSICKIIKEYGSYPKTLLDTTIHIYNYFPDYTICNSDAVVFLYRNMDTLYLTKKNKTIKYAFKSKYKHCNPKFDMKKLFNYNYINKYACESSKPMYIKYEPKNNRLYLIYTKYQKFENKDGTINKAINNPFSIIVFDSLFNNIGEFNISNEYSKFNSFPTSKGFALRNTKLSNKNKKATYIVYNIQETKKTL